MKTYGHMAARTLTLNAGIAKYELGPRHSGWRLDWAARHSLLGESPPIEKNWTPFFLQDSAQPQPQPQPHAHAQAHFIYSLHPLRVLRSDTALSPDSSNASSPNLSPSPDSGAYLNASTDPNPSPNPLVANLTLVSETRCPASAAAWEYGQMRGGTPALLVEGEFLTFFHSRVRLRASAFETYFMGALTFSADPPFRLLRQSRVPLLIDGMYEGAWAGTAHNDYIVFPMGYFVSDEVAGEGEGGVGLAAPTPTITLSLGRNDHEGWVAKMRVQDLMQSLVPLQCGYG